jgi:putative endonuclease
MFKKLWQKISRKEKGKQAEEIAEKYLISKGYKVLAKNYRTRFGEIDLIVQKGNTLVFVEVKSNFSGKDDFLPEEKVDLLKREKILRTAELYLLKNFKNLSKIKEMRLDVVVVRMPGAEVRHYEGAFYKEE